MQDDAGWRPTYCATAIVTPISIKGSADVCHAWCKSMIGREVWVTDDKGNNHAVGIIGNTKYENISVR